jgi:hypothetical protein
MRDDALTADLDLVEEDDDMEVPEGHLIWTWDGPVPGTSTAAGHEAADVARPA